jgi:uncharacterized membrane protein
MQSRAKLFGHSIHAMLIAFPVGLLVTAVIFDVMHIVAKAGLWATIAYYMICAGIIGGVAAALFGLIDYIGIPDATRAKRIGAIHGVGNVLVIGLFAASWWLRRPMPDEPSRTALILSFLGLTLAGGTSWLGGELVERLGVGVDDGAHLDAPSSLSGQPAARTSRHR